MSGPVVVEGIALQWHRLIPGRPPGGLGFFVPQDPNGVLSDFDDDEYEATDGRLPYFASLWPSAEGLCATLMAGPSLAGMRILDLGCGVGAVGLAAAVRGARVSFFDWEPRALSIVRASAQALRVQPEHCVAGDWREPHSMGQFDRIVGADVLYEDRNVPGVVGFLRSSLRPGAEAWIADPQRDTAQPFPDAARQAGLEVEEPRFLGRFQEVEVLLHVVRTSA